MGGDTETVTDSVDCRDFNPEGETEDEYSHTYSQSALSVSQTVVVFVSDVISK